ncbi:MBL fold metallo-hydrolase [Paenibacillus aurantiacus]|uniref:MBL fold metallo-hydrolase n=1 Tax=Paenibacillus aurantiacus TaxID=1936118 RepID=A0ABV5KIW6_9BACL
MKIEFLGTGGAVTIPRPMCRCHVCVEARKRGVPYSRSGPGVYVHGPNLLIDTSEDIYMQLNRSGVERIDAVTYSHWHPDHVMGRRVLESMSGDFRRWPPDVKPCDVILPEQVAADFEERLAGAEHLRYFESQGFIRQRTLTDGESYSSNGAVITPIRLAEDYVYAFSIAESDKRALIAMDEMFGWVPDPDLAGVDLAVLPAGIFEHHPITGERQIHEAHPVLKMEATFAQTLAIIERLNPRLTLLTHIEEMDGLGYDDLQQVEALLAESGRNIKFAYDTLVVEV